MKNIQALQGLIHGEDYSVNIKVRVTAIDAYIGDTIDQKLMVQLYPILRDKVIFSYDLTCISNEGKIKLKITPISSAVQRGVVYNGDCIMIKSLKKVFRGSFWYLIINEFDPCKESKTDNFNDNWIFLENYIDNNCPIGGNLQTHQLEILTNNDVLYKKSCIIERVCASTFVGTNNNFIDLMDLEKNWHTMAIKRPIIARVLYKSRLKIIFPKGIGYCKYICNLLISDLTGYTVVSAFDEAAIILYNEINENDCIMFSSSYKVSLYTRKTKSYLLHPKSKLCIDPTKIEIKINSQDLSQISIVENLDHTNTITNTVWVFRNISQLYQNCNILLNKVTDLIGVVNDMSRIERECMYNSNNKETGTYWLRMWLSLYDNTSNSKIYVKFYPSGLHLQKLCDIIPGDVIVLTNCIICDHNNTIFLTTTNETSIFHKQDLHSERFNSCARIVKNLIHDIFYSNIDRWMLRYRMATIGGYYYPFKGTISKNILNISLNRKFQVLNVVSREKVATL